MGLRKRRKADLVNDAVLRCYARNELYRGMFNADYLWIARHRKNLISYGDMPWDND